MLRAFRVIHLYVGVFIAPALLFFAFSGALQTFGLNDANAATGYKPPHWLAVMAQIHKKQTNALPVRRPGGPAPAVAAKPGTPDSGNADARPAPPPAAPAPAAPAKVPHMALKLFFALVCWGLFFSTVTGIYMAYKYRRNPVAVSVLLALGVVLPLVLLKF